MVVVPSILDSLGLATTTTVANRSTYYSLASDVKLTDLFNNSTRNLKPQATSPALSTAAHFDLTQLGDAFFTPVTYIGALDASNDWTLGWAVWNQ